MLNSKNEKQNENVETNNTYYIFVMFYRTKYMYIDTHTPLV